VNNPYLVKGNLLGGCLLFMVMEEKMIFDSILKIDIQKGKAEITLKRTTSTVILFDEYQVFEDSIEFYKQKKVPFSDDGGIYIMKDILIAYYKKKIFDAIIIEGIV